MTEVGKYSLEEYVHDLEQSIVLQEKILLKAEEDFKDSEIRVRVIQIHLAGLKENRKFLKTEAKVISLYEEQHKPGHILRLSEDIDLVKEDLLDSQKSLAEATKLVEANRKSLPQMKKQLEEALAKMNTTGQLIEAAHRFQKHHDDSGS